MSFSFSKRAATKAALLLAVAVAMDEVIASQPYHSRDRAAVEATAKAYVDLLDDDESKDVVISVSGSIAGDWRDNVPVTSTGVSLSITASLATKVETS